MSDIGETFRAARLASQEKRQQNRENSAEVLKAHGINFTSKNGGAHLVVKEKSIIDFWPGTGLWIDRENSASGRGVFKLIKYINKESAKND